MFNGRRFNFRQLSNDFNISTGMSLLAFHILTMTKSSYAVGHEPLAPGRQIDIYVPFHLVVWAENL